LLDPRGTRVLVGEREGTFSVFDLKSGKRLSRGGIRPPQGENSKLAYKLYWSSHGDEVVVVTLRGLNPGNVQSFDSRTGKNLLTFAPSTWSLTPFPSNGWIVCVRAELPVICDTVSGKDVQTLSDGHTNADPFISPAGTQIAMSDHNRITYIW